MHSQFKLGSFAFILSLVSYANAGLCQEYFGIPKAVIEQLAPVEKKVFVLPSYTTISGEIIEQVSVGYETYGKMNPEGTNVIFVAHHYSGNSHAAGKYVGPDGPAGYWDAIIGPGKAIDTNHWFVISADALTNLYPFNPSVHTTGPTSINPNTQKPYGKSFPAVTAEDFVRVHKALLDKLEVKLLHAVVGASGGSMQAFAWAVQYPDFVKHAVAVITPGLSVVGTDAQIQLNSWAEPILRDPEFQNGAYETQPALGLSQSLALTSFDTSFNIDLSNNWALKTFGTEWSKVTDEQKIKFAAPKMTTIDANSVVHTVNAYANFNLEAQASRIKAKVLMIPASSDHLFPPEMAERSRNILLKHKVSVEPNFVIQGSGGHLDGILQISQASSLISKFLEPTSKDTSP